MHLTGRTACLSQPNPAHLAVIHGIIHLGPPACGILGNRNAQRLVAAAPCPAVGRELLNFPALRRERGQVVTQYLVSQAADDVLAGAAVPVTGPHRAGQPRHVQAAQAADGGSSNRLGRAGLLYQDRFLGPDFRLRRVAVHHDRARTGGFRKACRRQRHRNHQESDREGGRAGHEVLEEDALEHTQKITKDY